MFLPEQSHSFLIHPWTRLLTVLLSFLQDRTNSVSCMSVTTVAGPSRMSNPSRIAQMIVSTEYLYTLLDNCRILSDLKLSCTP